MILEKGDLKEIEKIVDSSVSKAKKELREEIQKSGEGIKTELRKEIGQSKKEILKVLGQEISDLADINYAVITRTDQIDYRLRVVEKKLGLRSR